MIKIIAIVLSVLVGSILVARSQSDPSSSLSHLSPGVAISGSDLFYDVQVPGVGGVKVTGTQFLSWVFGNVSGNCTSSISGVFSCTGGNATGIAAGTNIATSGTGTNVTINTILTPTFTSITTTLASVTGWLTAAGVNMQTATIAGILNGSTANLTGNLTGTTGNFTGNLTSTSHQVTGFLTASGASFQSLTVAGNLTSGSGSFTTSLTAGNVQVSGFLTASGANFTSATIFGISGSTQCVQANSIGLLSGTSSPCSAPTVSIAAGSNISTTGTATNITVNVINNPLFTSITSTIASVTGWLTASGVNLFTETIANTLTMANGTTNSFGITDKGDGSLYFQSNIATSGAGAVKIVNYDGGAPRFQVSTVTDPVGRLSFGLDTSNNPQVGFGPGASNRDTFINRQATGTLGFGTTAQGIDASLDAGTMTLGNLGGSTQCVQSIAGVLTGTGSTCGTGQFSIAAGTNIATSGTANNITVSTTLTPTFTSLTSTNGSITTLTGGTATFQTVTINNLTPTGPNCLQETGGVVQATNAACGSGGGGTPGGSNTQVQFNSNSTFAGDLGLTYVPSTGGDTLTLGTTSLTGTVTSKGPALILQQTSDTFGTTSLTLQNRSGSNGAVFANPGVNLVDLQLKATTATVGGIRWEPRTASVFNTANLSEMQIGNTVAPNNNGSNLNVGGTYVSIASSGQAMGLHIYRDVATGLGQPQTPWTRAQLDWIPYFTNGWFTISTVSAGENAGNMNLLLVPNGGVVRLADTATPTAIQVFNTVDNNGNAINYEYGTFDWTGTSNQLTIGTKNGGTGVGRNVAIIVSNTNAQIISSTATTFSAAINAPAIAQLAANTTGYACWTTGTGAISEDSTTCLASLRRLKKDIVPFTDTTAELMALKPSQFQWKNPADANQRGQQLGFIAEDVRDIDSRLASYAGDGSLHGWRQDAMIAALVRGFQEQQAIIQRQQAEIDELKQGRHP